jgi:catechol 2,3-dioxygenase-like lactoylglutathione lyase family enzyme
MEGSEETNMSEIVGLHHVTAIASDPQKNIDFYAGVLGLRMVKLTVNYDDHTTYHCGHELGADDILAAKNWLSKEKVRKKIAA